MPDPTPFERLRPSAIFLASLIDSIVSTAASVAAMFDA
jgi:hypothetical protein